MSLITLPHVSTGQLITPADHMNPWIDGIMAMQPASLTITTTGATDTLPIPPGNGPLALFLTNASTLMIGGIQPGLDGQQLTLLSRGAGVVQLLHEHTSASLAYRLLTNVTSGPLAMYPVLGRAILTYTAAEGRWLLAHFTQGREFVVPFNASDFFVTGGTWTVAAGDVVSFTYEVRDTRMHVDFELQNTTLSGSGITILGIKIPGGYTTYSATHRPAWIFVNGVGSTGAVVYTETPYPDTILFSYTDLSQTFTPITDGLGVYGHLDFQVT